MERSMLGTFGKRLVAYVALVALGIVALMIVVGMVVGFVTTVLFVVALVAVAVAGLWLYRRL